MYQSVGCLCKVKLQVKIRYLAIESTEWDHVWMFGAHENPEESWRLPWDLANRNPSARNQKKNQTHGRLRIYHHHHGKILLVLVRCICFCETHVQLFEHLSIGSCTLVTHGYTCLLGVPDGIGEKSWEFMAGMKQEMQVSRVSQHSKYLMRSYLYLNRFK